jgi:hypothetical protein
MTGEGALERRYRRLLAWYPAEHRQTYAEEMIDVLLASAPEGSKRPGIAGAFDLIRGGLGARFRSILRWLACTDWPDALAACSVAVPVILLSYFTAGWLYHVLAGFLHGYIGAVHGQVERGLVVLAIAAPPLLGLQWRRTAAITAMALAAWLSIYTVSDLSPSWGGYWIVHWQEVSSSLALLLGTGALALSAGPRRAIEILTPRSWLVLIGSGIVMGLIHPYLSARPAWLAAVIVLAVLSVIAAGLMLTIPSPAARGLLILLAAPAYPGAAWDIGISGRFATDASGFPDVVLLPTVLFACLAAAAVWRSRRHGTA